MRRFQRAPVVISVVVGLFAIPSSGLAVDEKPSPQSDVRELLKQRVAVYSQVYEITRTLRDQGRVRFDQLLATQ